MTQGRATALFLGYQTDFSTLSAGPWQPISRYTDGVGETRGFEPDPILNRASFNTRDPVASAPTLPSVAGSLEAPICFREIGFLLRLALGAPATTGSAPNFTHVFKSGAASLPFATLQRRFAANDWRRIRGVMVNGFSLRAAKEGGFPRITFDVVGRDESAPANAALAGTQNAALELLRAPAALAAVRWGGVAIGKALAATLNFSNGLTPDNALNGTVYTDGFDLGETTIGGSFDVRYLNSTFETLANSETPDLLEIEWASPTLPSTRSITFALPRTKIVRQGMPITGPGPIQASYQIAPEQGASEAALVVTLKNDIASYTL